MASEHMNDENLEATLQAFDANVQHASEHHDDDPKTHLHTPADHKEAHAWLTKWMPAGAVQGMENRFHLGNYVIDRKTGNKSFEAMSVYVRIGMHLLYYGSHQEKALHWKRTQEMLLNKSVQLGKAYDAPESVVHIEPFIQSFNLQDSMVEMKEPDPKKYKSFNEFFAREIREDARPVDEPDNDLVTSSPADCRLTAFQTVDLATRYWIKGFGFTIGHLVGSEELGQKFEGGSIVIARLAPQDYHRFHAPVSGTVESITDIPGTYYTVNPQAINEPGTLDVFCENKRSVMMIKRTATGSSIAVIAVGAMLVGSIKYVNGAGEVGATVRRGQCLGAFYYGGSTVIVLYPIGEITIDDDLSHNSVKENCETMMKVGWRVGVKQ